MVPASIATAASALTERGCDGITPGGRCVIGASIGIGAPPFGKRPVAALSIGLRDATLLGPAGFFSARASFAAPIFAMPPSWSSPSASSWSYPYP